MRKEEKNSLLNLPNILSLLRILLIPVFLALMIRGKVMEASAVFFFAGFTDVLDGFAARLLHQRTKIGALLDPAGDKLLMTSAFIVLTIPSLNSPHIIPLWLTIAVISRDLFIVSSAFALYKLRGQKTFLPSLWGKSSTVCQFMVLILVLFFNSFQISFPYLRLLYFLTLALTLLSGMHYSYIGFRIISVPKRS
ncbi:MAG: CDP-alcohol phosphatidyltransferase family protein [Candidatus Aminicenantes bacterium]|nr:MAG: CDP-alcohol phosphatidyltransferase family protein [Candidatus Aminicenantes bacterium]